MDTFDTSVDIDMYICDRKLTRKSLNYSDTYTQCFYNNIYHLRLIYIF